MNVEFTKSFDKTFAGLPSPVQVKSRKTIEVFLEAYESRQFPKGLRIHKCGPFISLSVTMNFRVFVTPVTGGVRFVFIGDHDDADQYLRK